MRTVSLPSGERVPALGMGTWHMGDSAKSRAEEIATLRLGLDLGATLIDTAEMYGEGKSEALIGEAMTGRREEVFLVNKEQLAELDALFPPPTGPRPLEMLSKTAMARSVPPAPAPVLAAR